MTIKKIIKDTFQQEFDSEKMKTEILLKSENKKPSVIKPMLKFAIPFCMVVIILGTCLFYNQMSDKIYINKLEYRYDIARLNNEIEEEISAEESVFAILKNRKFPSDFEEVRYKKKIIKGDLEVEKYILTALGDNNRTIQISIEEKNLARNNKRGLKQSKINGNEVEIYKHNTTYGANFFYQGKYFDIKTNDISKDEFISLLKSILND